MKNIKNVLIVAGGTNSRFYQLSCFPKLLLPIEGHKSILQNDLESCKDTDVTVLMNSQYYNMTMQYMSELALQMNLIEAVNKNGSMNTIASAVQEPQYGARFPKVSVPLENVLILWSDLVVSRKNIEAIDKALDNIDRNLAVLTKTGEYRLGIGEDSKIHPELKNIPGIFYAKDLSIIKKYEVNSVSNYDFAEWICSFGDAKAVSIEDEEILELRDLDKYKEYIREVAEKERGFHATRFFNEISVENDILTKRCVVPAFQQLIDREKKWYANAPKDVIPTIYKSSSDEIKMSFVHGSTLEEWISSVELSRDGSAGKAKEADSKLEKFFERYWKALDKLHEEKVPVPKADLVQDLKEELVDKIIKRNRKISFILMKYDATNHLEELLNKAYEEICDWYDKSFSYSFEHPGCLMAYAHIHGDLNGSNVLVSDDGEIKFIDPRGYFGKSVGIGPCEYDYAKVLYALSGYDKFNNGYSIYDPDKLTVPEKLTEYLPEKLDNRIYRLMVGVIWIALAEYISADVMKSNIAFEYGLSLLEREYPTIKERELENGEEYKRKV